MKTYKKVMRPYVAIDKVTCDRCGDDCKNTHMDILVRYTFCNDSSLFETVCWKCYEENYKDKVIETRDKKFQNQLKDAFSVNDEVKKE